MYKILTIGGKDYKLVYSVEASLYQDCIDTLIGYLGNVGGIIDEKKLTDGLEKTAKIEVRRALVSGLRDQILNLPNTALTLFYAGLMEHHGEDGDGTIPDKRAARRLVLKLFEEQKSVENGIKDFAALLAVCMDQIAEDGFFKLTGLETIANTAAAVKPNRAARRAAKKVSGPKS